jgi:hypothetical protein
MRCHQTHRTQQIDALREEANKATPNIEWIVNELTANCFGSAKTRNKVRTYGAVGGVFKCVVVAVVVLLLRVCCDCLVLLSLWLCL